MAALYLKYRPQSLDQLIGQDSVKKILLSSFESGKLSHAYLFVGPRGTGKTSTARILAKMVNCERQSDKTKIPCNECATCLSVTDGSNLDLIEIDAASNRGIDDIRALRDTIKLSTTGAKKKIYIIDEVHMLTTEAFNALLKTLEEPPSHVLFILATTEINKIPQTIMSRVQRLDFKLATIADLSLALKSVAEGEKIKISDETLETIAKKADGSFRDAVKFLDQVQASGEFSLESVQKLLGSSNFNDSIEFLNLLSEKQTKPALEWIIKQAESGANIKSLTLSLMDLFRSLVLIKNGLEIVKAEYDSEKYENLNTLSQKFSIQDLVHNLEILQKSLENLKSASILSLPLELAVVEMCSNVIPVKTGIQLTNIVEDLVDRGPVIVQPHRASSVVSLPAASRRGAPDDATPQNDNTVSLAMIGDENKTDDQVSPDIAKLNEKWTYVLETIKPYNFSLEALLRNVKIASCDEGLVVLEVPYSFHQRILEAPKSRDLLESVFSEVLGKSIRVSAALGVRPQRVEDIANVEMAPEDEIISLASEIFNGKLVD